MEVKQRFPTQSEGNTRPTINQRRTYTKLKESSNYQHPKEGLEIIRTEGAHARKQLSSPFTRARIAAIAADAVQSSFERKAVSFLPSAQSSVPIVGK